jgi:hypothetical protein
VTTKKKILGEEIRTYSKKGRYLSNGFDETFEMIQQKYL